METDKSKIYADVMKKVDIMDGHTFEYFCAKLLEQCEFRDVEVTRGSGDYGVDITARYHNLRYAIQCKRHSKNVNLKAVQEVGMGAEFYHCDVSVVLCNGYFAKSAINMAEQTGVRLWDRNYLLDLISQCEDLDFIDELTKKENDENESKQVNSVQTKKQKNKKMIQQKEKSKKSKWKWFIIILILCIASCIANIDEFKDIIEGEQESNNISDDITGISE